MSITTAGDASGFLKTVLSTITSPLPLDVVIIYKELDVGRVCVWSVPARVRDLYPDGRATAARRHPKRFKVFREMYMTREFRLVLCADVLGCSAEFAVRVLKCIVRAERTNGGLDYLPCEPLIISEMRSPRSRPGDNRVGWEGELPIYASAL